MGFVVLATYARYFSTWLVVTLLAFERINIKKKLKRLETERDVRNKYRILFYLKFNFSCIYIIKLLVVPDSMFMFPVKNKTNQHCISREKGKHVHFQSFFQ